MFAADRGRDVGAAWSDTNRDSFLIVTFCRFLSVRLHFSSSEGIYVMPSHFSASGRGLSTRSARLIDERAKINVQLNYSISWKRKLNGNYLCLAPERFTVVAVMSGADWLIEVGMVTRALYLSHFNSLVTAKYDNKHISYSDLTL